MQKLIKEKVELYNRKKLKIDCLLRLIKYRNFYRFDIEERINS